MSPRACRNSTATPAAILHTRTPTTTTSTKCVHIYICYNLTTVYMHPLTMITLKTLRASACAMTSIMMVCICLPVPQMHVHTCQSTYLISLNTASAYMCIHRMQLLSRTHSPQIDNTYMPISCHLTFMHVCTQTVQLYICIR